MPSLAPSRARRGGVVAIAFAAAFLTTAQVSLAGEDHASGHPPAIDEGHQGHDPAMDDGHDGHAQRGHADLDGAMEAPGGLPSAPLQLRP